jgi:glycosyltransferase involved in cell wall biosynthesis
VLYVGTLEPRKNLIRLVQACDRLWRAGQLDRPLVLIGKRGWLADELFRFVEDAGCRDRVVLPGYVAREDLPAVYSAASVCAYPSLCEGFGLPPLEAMACGTPVVASTSTSLPEVLGNAAPLVDPLDVDAIAEAIRTVIDDDGLRARLRAAGLARAREFRWDVTARRTLAVYDEIARGG